MKRYFKHSSESKLGEGTTWLELEEEYVKRQVEKYNNQWFSSHLDYDPLLGGTLCDQPLLSELEPGEEITQGEFEQVWNEAGISYETRCKKARELLQYVSGDATLPQGKGNKIIAHICNDVGAWGKGFVVAISKRWDKPEQVYRGWYKEFVGQKAFGLGSIQLVQVESDIWVVNMVAQHGIRKIKNDIPLRYESLKVCLEKLVDEALTLKASVHIPRIGAGLAGGDWKKIELLVLQAVCLAGVEVFVYDLP